MLPAVVSLSNTVLLGLLVFDFFFFFSDGTQKAASHQEMRAETGQRDGFSTVRLQGPLLGQRQEGRLREDLPESKRCGCRKGAEIVGEEGGERRRLGEGAGVILLPAS